MQLKYILIATTVTILALIWWQSRDNSDQTNTRATTPTSGIQNDDELLMLTALQDAKLTSYAQNPSAQSLAQDIRFLLENTGHGAQEQWLRAQLSQLRSMNRMDADTCGKMIKNPEQYSPTEVRKLISDSAQKQSLDALKAIIKEQNYTQLSPFDHTEYAKLMADAKTKVGSMPHQIEAQDAYHCRLAIATAEVLLALPEGNKRPRAILAHFSYMENPMIFVF
ncbi:MAG: hypothetical protein Q4C68_07460 [Moraxella sp.]|nr:hypothetical protein [Moraxella sp.]